MHRVTVADSGPGLDDAQKQRAFDRFWRGSIDSGGTGLGLPIVQSLAEAAGGTVSLEDNHPCGLEVVVELPASQQLLS